MRKVSRKWWIAGLLAGCLSLGGALHAADNDQPLALDTILKLKAAELTDKEVGALVDKRGVGFSVTADVAEKLIAGGCGPELVKQIRAAADKAEKSAKDAQSATPVKPGQKDPAAGVKLPGKDDGGLMPGMQDDDPLPLPAPKANGEKPGANEDDPLPMPKAKPSAADDDPLPAPMPKAPPPKDPKATATPAPKPAPANPFKKNNPIDDLEKTTEPAPELIYGQRVAEEKQKQVEESFKAILKASGLPLEISASKHITLIASAANAAKFLPDMKALEAKLERQFTGPIRTGPDKRSAILILLDTQADYRTWITAEYTAFKLDKGPADGQGGANPMLMALNARGSFFPFAGVTDLSAFQNDQDRKKSIAYSLGYLYMHSITEGHAPDCFITGFGNYCEALMYTDPMTRVYSYEERNIAAGPKMTWVNQMKDEIQQKKAATSDDVIGFSTVTMKSVDYVQAWSLVTFLTGRPKEFEGVVTALRDRNGAMKAITAYYKYDNKTLDYYWKNWANTQN